MFYLRYPTKVEKEALYLEKRLDISILLLEIRSQQLEESQGV